MLQISPTQIAEVIILSRDIERSEAEFDAFVRRLAEDEQAALVAIFWIGRGSFEAGDVQLALDTAANEATIPTENYLKGSPHLADHLEAGMEALGLDPSDAEDDLYRRG